MQKIQNPCTDAPQISDWKETTDFVHLMWGGHAMALNTTSGSHFLEPLHFSSFYFLVPILCGVTGAQGKWQLVDNSSVWKHKAKNVRTLKVVLALCLFKNRTRREQRVPDQASAAREGADWENIIISATLEFSSLLPCSREHPRDL